MSPVYETVSAQLVNTASYSIFVPGNPLHGRIFV